MMKRRPIDLYEFDMDDEFDTNDIEIDDYEEDWDDELGDIADDGDLDDQDVDS